MVPCPPAYLLKECTTTSAQGFAKKWAGMPKVYPEPQVSHAFARFGETPKSGMLMWMQMVPDRAARFG